ncbi:TPA: hypothetical protein OLL76_003707, partial [Acinetobacter baumannii]|nr:hypothetical protein [Acinetobacter baumannii]
WNGSKGQLRMLQHGQVHSSFDNAFAHCCAIIKISGGEFAGDILKLLNKPTKEVEEEKPLENDVEKSPQVNTEKTVIEEPTKDLKEDLDSAIVVTEGPYVSSSEDLLVPETNEPKVDPEYQKALDALLQRVKESKTPAEVNAVYRYTRTWDDEQMKPILLATHKRLEELEKEKASANEPPSLMVQIQTAPDLTTLDALEIDVAARDPQIQPKLMGYVRKRRYELENPTPTQPEADPDYLLVDGF